MADKFNLDGFSVDENDVCTADGGFVGDVTGDIIGNVDGIVQGQYTSYVVDGAIDVNDSVASLVPTVETLEMSLANGIDGQQITIVADGSSFNAVVTPANLSGGTTITFDAASEYADLIFSTSWFVYRTNATVA